MTLPQTFWMLAHPTSCAALTRVLYDSERAAVRALGLPDEDSEGSEVERQRRRGWRVVRVRVIEDACSLCGEPWESGHECVRSE